MAELQDRYQAYAERDGLVEIGHLPAYHSQKAIIRSVFTMDRAVAVFDGAVQHLGEMAWIDPEGGDVRRRLYVRDPSRPAWLVPVPLLEHAWIAGIGQVTFGAFINRGAVNPEDAPEDWQPGDAPWWPTDLEPDVLPQGPDMRGGSLRIAEGPAYVEIRYDDRGVRSEATWSAGGDTFWYARGFNTRPWVLDPLARPPTPRPLALACRPELSLQGHTVDELLGWVLELDPAKALPHRVLLPLPAPGGVAGAWSRALGALREAAFEGRIPDEASGWVVVDAFEGRALAIGADFDEAVERWRAEVQRVRPRPPRAVAGGDDDGPIPEERPPEVVKEDKATWVSFGAIRIEAPPLPAIPWPIPLPQHVPAAAVPVSPLPAVPEAYRAAGFHRVVRMFGEHGDVAYGVLREEVDGFLLVGHGMLDVVDPLTVPAEVDAAMAEQRAMYDDAPEGFPNPFKDRPGSQVHVFRGWDDARRCRAPMKHVSGSWGAFSAKGIAGEVWAWAVVRGWR